MIDQMTDLAVPFLLCSLVVAALVEVSRRGTFLWWTLRGKKERPTWWRQVWRLLSIVYGFGAGYVAGVTQDANVWEYTAIGAGAGLLSTVVVGVLKARIKAAGAKAAAK
jgi:hypothetical protein